MGIFDVFTGDAAKKAALQQQSYFDQTQKTNNANIDQSLGQSLGYVNTGAGQATGDINSGYGQATGAVNTGASNALGYLGQGNQAATNYLGQASAAYQPLTDLAGKYGAGTNLLLDSYGANGAAGNQRAQDAFHTAPGYDFQVSQGLDAINRRRNAGGMLNSGNADRDAQTFGQGLANQAYTGWQSGLQGLVNPELSATQGAASGLAGINTTGANMANNFGQSQAGVATGAANSLSSLYSGQGNALSGIDTNQGQSLASLTQGSEGQKLGLQQSILQPYANTYGQVAAAENAGSKNLWNLGLSAASMAAGLPPGTFSLGSASSPNMPKALGSFGLG